MPTIPPHILAAIVVVGVSLLLALTRLVGWQKRARISDLEAATAALLLDQPEVRVADGVVADDGLASPMLVGEARALADAAEREGIDLTGIETLSAATDENADELAALYCQRRPKARRRKSRRLPTASTSSSAAAAISVCRWAKTASS